MDLVIEMGASLDILVNTGRPTAPIAQSTTNNPVAHSVSSRIGARGLSPLMENDDDDDDDNGDEGAALLGQKMTTVKTFSTRTFSSPLNSEGHCNVSPPQVH